MTDLYANQNFVYFDIETLPTQSEEVKEAIRAGIKPPSQYKKPESINEWCNTFGAAAADAEIAKTSFDGALGHVCTISWAVNDGDVETRHIADISDEKAMLVTFFNALDPYHSETLVGHYIAGFDIPFLTKRAIILGVKLPPATAFPRDPKPWEKVINDTMFMWAGAKGTIGMDKLCEILGIEGKGDFDGKMVADAWANGDHQRIADYCADDVRRTREIHQRFLKAGF